MLQVRRYRSFSLLFLFFTAFSLNAQESFENDTVMAYRFLRERGEVYFSFSARLNEVRHLSNIISVDNYRDGIVYAYANREEFDAFLEESFEFTVYTPPGTWYLDKPGVREIPDKEVPDVMIPEREIPELKMPEREIPDNEMPVVRGEWDFYPTFDEYLALMQSFAVNYAGICEYVDAGSSVGGRSILFLRITGDKDSVEPKPRFMYSSTMHGDETVGFILMLRLIEYLLENYPDDEQVERILDNLEVWINPLANPDGAYFGSDGNTIVSPKRNNANNQDINRNFPVIGDEEYDTEGREPETVVMMELMESMQFTLSANLHGGSEVMNYPWDTWQRRHADDGWFEYICREYADTAIWYSLPEYMTFLGGVTNGWDWYSISGGRQDYVTYFTGGREITMEISDDKHPPPDALTGYWDYNRRSLLNYMEQATFGIRGMVSDAVTTEPLRAKVEILSHDTDGSHVYSDPENGWYFRLAGGGTYDILFSAEGYHSRLFDNVSVTDRETSRIDVQLNPSGTISEGITRNDGTILNVFPSPSAGRIHVSFDLPEPAGIQLVLYDRAGRMIRMLYSGNAGTGHNHISLDISDINPGIYIFGLSYGRNRASRKIIVHGL